MRVLTTGAGSGMGRYVHENLGGLTLTRDTAADEVERLKREGVDVIIHCAFNSLKEITPETLHGYYMDNVGLTGEILKIPHRRMVFFSTVDIYCGGQSVHSEEEVISLNEIKGIYAATKAISEALVRHATADHLILRLTTPVGQYSRKNTLMRLIDGEEGPYYLSPDSVFNYVLYPDVLGFIKHAVDKGLSGTFNIASSANISLSEVAYILGRKARFGEHRYTVGNISNGKAASVFPAFRKTSEEVLVGYVKELANA